MSEQSTISTIIGFLFVIVALLLENLIARRTAGKPIPVSREDNAYVDTIIAAIRTEREEDMADLKAETNRLIMECKQECDEQMQGMQTKIDFLVEQLVELGRISPLPATVEKPKRKNPVILGMWPKSDLAVRKEIDAIFRSGLEYIPMDGAVARVTIRNSFSEVERTLPVIIHFGGHATEEGTEFDDGIAPVGWWATLVRTFPSVQLVVLNACRSLDIVDAMQDAGVTAVVGIRGDISDVAAIEFTREFYSRIMRGLSVDEAARRAKQTLGDHQQSELITARDPHFWTLKGSK